MAAVDPNSFTQAYPRTVYAISFTGGLDTGGNPLVGLTIDLLELANITISGANPPTIRVAVVTDDDAFLLCFDGSMAGRTITFPTGFMSADGVDDSAASEAIPSPPSSLWTPRGFAAEFQDWEKNRIVLMPANHKVSRDLSEVLETTCDDLAPGLCKGCLWQWANLALSTGSTGYPGPDTDFQAEYDARRDDLRNTKLPDVGPLWHADGELKMLGAYIDAEWGFGGAPLYGLVRCKWDKETYPYIIPWIIALKYMLETELQYAQSQGHISDEIDLDSFPISMWNLPRIDDGAIGEDFGYSAQMVTTATDVILRVGLDFVIGYLNSYVSVGGPGPLVPGETRGTIANEASRTGEAGEPTEFVVTAFEMFAELPDVPLIVQTQTAWFIGNSAFTNFTAETINELGRAIRDVYDGPINLYFGSNQEETTPANISLWLGFNRHFVPRFTGSLFPGRGRAMSRPPRRSPVVFLAPVVTDLLLEEGL